MHAGCPLEECSGAMSSQHAYHAGCTLTQPAAPHASRCTVAWLICFGAQVTLSSILQAFKSTEPWLLEYVSLDMAGAMADAGGWAERGRLGGSLWAIRCHQSCRQAQPRQPTSGVCTFARMLNQRIALDHTQMQASCPQASWRTRRATAPCLPSSRSRDAALRWRAHPCGGPQNA